MADTEWWSTGLGSGTGTVAELIDIPLQAHCPLQKLQKEGYWTGRLYPEDEDGENPGVSYETQWSWNPDGGAGGAAGVGEARVAFLTYAPPGLNPAGGISRGRHLKQEIPCQGYQISIGVFYIDDVHGRGLVYKRYST